MRPAADLASLRSRRPTINDIARLANVSKKTVSRVINQSPFVKEETRARIDAVIAQIGYAPDPQARGLAFRSSFLIGLIYDNPNAQYIVNIQDGALDALRGSGFELVVHPCDRKSADFLSGVRRFVERQKLHGVILLPPVSEDPALARTLDEINCRTVRIASVRFEDAPRMVVSNDREATGEAARYLESLGHRRIGLIAGPSQYRSAHERQAGFLSSLEQRGIHIPPELIVEGGYTFESGVACAEMLLSRNPRPTAIFASNDEMAAGVYKAAHRLGIRIPEQLSVVGFDDSPLASRIWPPLTTIRLPIREMGRLAAAKLIPPRTREDADAGGISFVAPHLIVRESCQPPRT
ncbi:MAG TPA: LacI family DNA-binding transcriptional regulator [Steroidobacteraceae bacterium]